METVIDGVAYVSAPETKGCIGCAVYLEVDVCEKLIDIVDCQKHRLIWLKKDEVRQQVEVNKAFGHQMPRFPEIEPTAEDYDDISKKVILWKP